MCHEEIGHEPIASQGGSSERSFNVETDGASMPVFAAQPALDSQGRVIIIHDIYGANDFYHDLARRLAASGFSAYLPDLFVRQGALPEQTREYAMARGGKLSYPQALKDIENLISHEGEDERWGAVGFCMGGTLVMHLASAEPRLSAGVIYYGFPATATITANRPTEPMRETSLVDAPLLGFWGDQDHGVGMHNVETYSNLLETAGKEKEFHIYPGRPHGFLTFDESSDNYADSQDSWGRALAFFGERLGG
jgi:carboxymethylenebutenolidase